jgi:hypothetical protein
MLSFLITRISPFPASVNAIIVSYSPTLRYDTEQVNSAVTILTHIGRAQLILRKDPNPSIKTYCLCVKQGNSELIIHRDAQARLIDTKLYVLLSKSKATVIYDINFCINDLKELRHVLVPLETIHNVDHIALPMTCQIAPWSRIVMKVPKVFRSENFRNSSSVNVRRTFIGGSLSNKKQGNLAKKHPMPYCRFNSEGHLFFGMAKAATLIRWTTREDIYTFYWVMPPNKRIRMYIGVASHKHFDVFYCETAVILSHIRIPMIKDDDGTDFHLILLSDFDVRITSNSSKLTYVLTAF